MSIRYLDPERNEAWNPMHEVRFALGVNMFLSFCALCTVELQSFGSKARKRV